MTDKHDLGPLLSSALAGEAGAREALLAKVRPYLHLLVRQQLERTQRYKLGDSDIVQETLMRIHCGLKQDTKEAAAHFQGNTPAEFLGWIGQIVRNVIADMQRRGLALRRDERREVTGSKLLATLTRGSAPEQGAERAEKAVLLALALERLPQHQREVLQWRVFDQLSYDQISEETGKSVGALRVVVTRALEALRGDAALRKWIEASL